MPRATGQGGRLTSRLWRRQLSLRVSSPRDDCRLAVFDRQDQDRRSGPRNRGPLRRGANHLAPANAGPTYRSRTAVARMERARSILAGCLVVLRRRRWRRRTVVVPKRRWPRLASPFAFAARSEARFSGAMWRDWLCLATPTAPRSTQPGHRSRWRGSCRSARCASQAPTLNLTVSGPCSRRAGLTSMRDRSRPIANLSRVPIMRSIRAEGRPARSRSFCLATGGGAVAGCDPGPVVDLDVSVVLMAMPRLEVV